MNQNCRYQQRGVSRRPVGTLNCFGACRVCRIRDRRWTKVFNIRANKNGKVWDAAREFMGDSVYGAGLEFQPTCRLVQKIKAEEIFQGNPVRGVRSEERRVGKECRDGWP